MPHLSPILRVCTVHRPCAGPLHKGEFHSKSTDTLTFFPRPIVLMEGHVCDSDHRELNSVEFTYTEYKTGLLNIHLFRR